MSVETNQRLQNILSISIVKYGSERWILRALGCRCLEVSLMYFMRALTGKTRRDRIRNQDIRTYS